MAFYNGAWFNWCMNRNRELNNTIIERPKHLLLSNEIILPNEHSVYFGYTYIAEVQYTMSMVATKDESIKLIFVQSSIEGMVVDLKKYLEKYNFPGCKVLNIRRCDIFGHTAVCVGDELKKGEKNVWKIVK